MTAETAGTLKSLLKHVDARLTHLREQLAEARTYGVNTPGFNQTLGAIDELQMLLDVIAPPATS